MSELDDATSGMAPGRTQSDTASIGGDPKYGRIYTEADVAAMIDWLTAGALESTPEEVVQEAARQVTLRFPDDEPLFVLRGQDRFALDTLDAYAARCAENTRAAADPSGYVIEGEPVQDAHMQAVGRTTMAFRHFQNNHPDRIKTPDS